MLSLEAPIVAVLWQAALAKAHGIQLTPMLGLGLGLATWTIYVLDRTLDTFGSKADALSTRHVFYRRHRLLLLALFIPAALVVQGWIAFWVIPEGILWQAVGLGMLVVLYLAAYASSGSRIMQDCLLCSAGLGAIILITRMELPSGFRLTLSIIVLSVMVLTVLRQINAKLVALLPKEHAAALLFALGCTASIRFLSMPENWAEPMLECAILALLFLANLRSISCQEHAGAENSASHVAANTAMLTGNLLVLSGILFMIHRGSFDAALAGPATASLVGTALLAVLHRFRTHFSIESHRALADLATIAPLPLIWL